MPTFSGLDYTKVHAYRIISARYAVKGLGYDHATESGTFGAREPGSLKLNPKTITDAFKRNYTYGYVVEGNLPSLQANIPALKNAMLLSKQELGMYFLTAEGKYLTFDTNNGRCLGLSYAFELTSDKRSLAATVHGYVTKTEWDTILTGAGSAPANMTGGTSVGLTAQDYTLADISEPYIDTIQITNSSGAALVGAIQDPVIKHTMTARLDQYGRPVGKQAIMAEVTWKMMESDIADLQAAAMTSKEDCTLLATTLNGDSFKYTSGAGLITFAPYFGDDDRYVECTLAGEMIYNTDEATPDSIDAGVTSSTIFECKLRGAV